MSVTRTNSNGRHLLQLLERAARILRQTHARPPPLRVAG